VVEDPAAACEQHATAQPKPNASASELLRLVLRTQPPGVWTFPPFSRSETTMVAVGLSPRAAAKHRSRRRGATAERSNRTVAFNRRSATRNHNTPHSWTEVHGYHHGLAPRGVAGAPHTAALHSRIRPPLWIALPTSVTSPVLEQTLCRRSENPLARSVPA